MQVNVAQLIADLLYEYDAVSIPKFGGLTTTYRSAAIDQVEGKLQPPTKELSFNENIVVNDGLLLGQLQTRSGLSQEEAEQQLEQFVSELKDRIDRGEEVNFPNLGKFYIGSNQAINFVPDTTNFNTDAYGLPEVKFYPVTKGGIKPAFEKVATPPRPKPTPAPDSSSNLLMWLMIVLGILALLTVYMSRQYLFPASDGVGNENDQAAIRINEKPSNRVDDTVGEEDLIIEDGDPRNEEEVRIRDGQREAIIVVGLYGQSKNARNAVERIYKMGYEAITDDKDGMFQVAARFGYSGEAELQRVHARLKRNFDKDAWIKKE